MSGTLRRRMLSGAAWTLGLRLLTRALGVVSTLIVARNIPQSELGAYGVMAILGAGVAAITGIGLGGAVIQMEDDPAEYVHTAWTVDAVRSVMAYAFEFAVAPYWCAFFRVPEVTNVLRVYALGQLVLGFHSASTVLLMREVKLGRLAIIYTVESLVFCTVAIAGALLTKSYLSLVAATLISYVARAVASYLVHPYRPRLELDWPKAARMFRFVRWTMAYTGADFFLDTFDNAVTARLIGTTALARYRMGYQMAMEGPSLLQYIVVRVAFPAIARVQSSAALVRKNALAIIGFTAATIVPAAVGLAMLAPRVVELLLGAKWLPAVVPLQLLALAGIARSLMDVAPPILRGLGKTRADFTLKLLHVVLLCGLLVPFAVTWGVTGIAVAVDIAAAVSLPIVFVVLARTLEVRSWDLARAALPPFGATVLAMPAFLVRGGFWTDLGGGLLFGLAYVLVSWGFVRVWPNAGIGAAKGIGDEAS